MTLLVRNEQDIIRENIEFHLSQGVTHFIVTDNRSTDSTKNILKEYENKGILRYIFETNDNYNQHEWVTRMAVMAYVEYRADWVINNDADEFWWPRSGNLADSFESVSSSLNLVEAHRHNFVMMQDTDLPFYQRMIYREIESLNAIGQSLPAKVAHRGNAKIKISQGNHAVSGFRNQQRAKGVIDILHFPMRTYLQFVNKINKGGAAYMRNKILSAQLGITWKMLYSKYQKNNNLIEYCNQHKYDKERIQAELASGAIVEDNRLADYLNGLAALL